MRRAACCRPPFYYNTDLETHLNMNKKTILTLIALTALLTVEAQQHRTVQFFAHRGSRLEYDENTMPAFRATYDKGIRGYETDIRMTADGRLVVSHDSSLKRLTPCDGEVEKMTAKQIRAVKTNQGNDILFLDELCRWLADKEGMYVEFEMKTSSPAYDEQQLERYCDLLYTTAMKHKPASSTYLFTSSDKRALRTMQRLHPDAGGPLATTPYARLSTWESNASAARWAAPAATPSPRPRRPDSSSRSGPGSRSTTSSSA